MEKEKKYKKSITGKKKYFRGKHIIRKKIKIKHNKEKKGKKRKGKRQGKKHCSGKSIVAINNVMCGELQCFPHTIYNPYLKKKIGPGINRGVLKLTWRP